MSKFDTVSKMVEEVRAQYIADIKAGAAPFKEDGERASTLYVEADGKLNDFGYRIVNAQVIGFLQAKLTYALNEIDTLKEIYNEEA